MKTVPLHGKHGTGRVALVDDEDYDLVMQYKWLAHRGRNETYYAVCNIRDSGGRPLKLAMHTLITGFECTDHENHDGLDNRRSNLRDGGSAGNQRNMRKITVNTSRFKGVCWDKRRQKWHVRISVNGHQTTIGRFTSEMRAALAYDAAAREHFGEYAWLNFPLNPDADAAEPPEIDRSMAARTHCKNGHEFTPENTRLAKDAQGHVYRACRACRRELARKLTGAKPRGSGNGYAVSVRSRGAA